VDCGEENPDDVERLFPAGSASENRFDTVSALCSLGMRPHVMTGFLKWLLMQHYVDPENLAEIVHRTRFREANGWRADERTGIYIESVTRWRPELAESRPALLVKRNEWKWERVTIGGQAGSDYVEGAEHFHGFWRGSHTVFVVGGKAAEVELLASETNNFLLRAAPQIAEQMSLHRFIPVGMGALAVVEESTKNYAVPLTFAYAAEENWTLTPLAPRLKRITFKRSDLF
jgi:hypothetical protein